MATYVLIHGAWHDASCWDPLVASLRELGHDAVAPDLPCDDPRAGYEQRAEPAVRALASRSGPAVIVGHSAALPDITVANSGQGPMPITGFTLTGSASRDYSLQTTCPSTLPAGQSCVITPIPATAVPSTSAEL